MVRLPDGGVCGVVLGATGSGGEAAGGNAECGRGGGEGEAGGVV